MSNVLLANIELLLIDTATPWNNVIEVLKTNNKDTCAIDDSF